MENDIFDSIMTIPILRLFNSFYARHKVVLLYLFFGGLSFFVNVGSFVLCAKLFAVNELVANVLAWIITVLFVYVTNKIWVFKSNAATKRELAWQLASFFAGRLGTLLLEEVLLLVFITKLGINNVVVKIAAQIVVIVANYLISKIIVFRRNNFL